MKLCIIKVIIGLERNCAMKKTSKFIKDKEEKDGTVSSSEKSAAESEENVSGQDVRLKPKKKKFFRRRWFKNAVRIIILAIIVFGVIMFVRFKMGRKQEAPVPQTTSEVTRGSVDVRVTGSGTVQPIESYTLTSLVEGKIIQCDYDAGQTVEEGAVLYRFEDTESQSKLQAAENAVKTAKRAAESALKQIDRAKRGVESAREELADARKNIDDIYERIDKLTVYAPISGVIEELNAEVGDNASGSLGQIRDYNDLSATVSFNAIQIDKIKEGDSVSVGIAKLMSEVGGTVADKYTAPHVGADGTILYTVKIKLDSGVKLAAGTAVSVTVHTAEGDVECPTYGTVSYAEPKSIELDEDGEVVGIYVKSGNYVQKGEIIAKLSSDALQTELKNAEDAYQAKVDALSDAEDSVNDMTDAYDNALDGITDAENSLETVRKEVEDYTITSPVSGVILEKYYKAGDTYGSDDSNKKLMVVADMSKMVFSINVDELDISNIQLGQQVNITADALPGEMISGTVTTVSKIGNAENGVTGYPVEITIYDTGNLMSGMNVTAEINVGSVQDVIVAPATAIFMIDGEYYATVVTPGETEDGGETETQVRLEVGLHSSELYEIKSGLSEGDILRDSGIGSDDEDDAYMYGW